MDELVTWLRAQLDDDERAARAWLPFGNPTDADRDHFARHDPLRVLAEVDAKRRIIDWALAWLEREVAPWNADLIRMLALPYADRAGYREEWRP